MSDRAPSVLDRLRRPEHTGSNRCAPCTVLNVVLALAGALVLSEAWIPAAAVLVFLAALGVIWARGSLVPGTPALTRRYLPDRVLEALGKEANPARDRTVSRETVEKIERERTESVDAEAYLRELGAATTPANPDDASENGADVRRDESFAERVREIAAERRDDPRDPAAIRPAVRHRALGRRVGGPRVPRDPGRRGDPEVARRGGAARRRRGPRGADRA